NGSRSRAEKLADNFAAALLMPSELLVEQLQEWKNAMRPEGELRASEIPPKSWFKKVSELFEVSVQALKFRLINARLLIAEAFASVDLEIHEKSASCPAFGRILL